MISKIVTDISQTFVAFMKIPKIVDLLSSLSSGRDAWSLVRKKMLPILFLPLQRLYSRIKGEF